MIARTNICLYIVFIFGAVTNLNAADKLEKQFRELPMEARRLTGPLFWLHGDKNETREYLSMYLEKIAEGGNGCFTAESRPHNDWLGPGWYRDLAICLEAAKKHNLQMWIFDERWWPSQSVDGKIPPRYAAKRLASEAINVKGPRLFEADGYGGDRYVATIAGRVTKNGTIKGDSLMDLATNIHDSKLYWQVPAGQWKIMKFTHVHAPRLGWSHRGYLLDGASKDSVDWFLQTVYQPHYDRFKADFGKTIRGFFYDEPETSGDWGTELNGVLAERKVDWKKAYVAYKFKLAGEEQVAAKYQYLDAFAEAWGRTMYGSITKWCEERGVISIGHFMEHGHHQERTSLYCHRDFCAGDMMRLQGYSSMGGIDAVYSQFMMGLRDTPKDPPCWQTPKLGSSITHAYGKPDDVAMVEIFGARGQDLTYPEMKWWTDHMHVSGINFHIPHSFNPRSPNDTDCPPYFYNNGHEPRWPLYRVYADYTSRLSLMLTGGRHVCPVAILFNGNTRRVGKMIAPNKLSEVLQDALFDCDWIPFEVFENDVESAGKELKLRNERYRVLVVPGAEVITYATLTKAKEFYDAGGCVVGYGLLPSNSATIGKTSADIASLREAIWGRPQQPDVKVCKINSAGGRSYFLPTEPTPQQLQQVLTADAGIHPTLEVLKGDTSNWLHVLHRVKENRNVFFICNQNHQGTARDFLFKLAATGVPEIWDPMRNEITSIPFQRIDDKSIELPLALEPLESVLVVFRKKAVDRPVRIGPDNKPAEKSIVVTQVIKAPLSADSQEPKHALNGCNWIWYPERESAVNAPQGTRYFRKVLSLPKEAVGRKATFIMTADNGFVLYINGKKVGSNNNWNQLNTFDLSKFLRPEMNLLAIQAFNAGDEPNPAGLIGCLAVELDDGRVAVFRTDNTWKTGIEEAQRWNMPDYDDTAWVSAKEIAIFGGGPWQTPDQVPDCVTRSPVKAADLFKGRFELPADWLFKNQYVCLEADGIAPEAAAAVSINDRYVGGFLGKPYRLNISAYVKAGKNTVEITPFAPASVRVVNYSR